MWLKTRRQEPQPRLFAADILVCSELQPTYSVTKEKSFTAMVVEDLCKLYGVKKLRTSSYHAQTNGQVERMNQTLIHLIGKLDEDKKACWLKHLPELLMAYNSTCSAVTGYSPPLPAFWQEAEDTSRLLVSNLVRYASQI